MVQSYHLKIIGMYPPIFNKRIFSIIIIILFKLVHLSLLDNVINKKVESSQWAHVHLFNHAVQYITNTIQ